MDTAEQLIGGYTAYTDAEEVGASATTDAPAATPTYTVVTISGVKCAIFSVGLVTSFSAGYTVSRPC